MKKKVIILSNNYPYGKGEEFLEKEMEYINDVFEEVIIYSGSPTDEITRTITDKIKVFRFSRINFKTLGCVKNFKLAIKELKFLNETKRFKVRSLKKFLRYYLNVEIKKKDLRKSINIDEVDQTIVYSYWADDSLLAALLLKQEFKNLTVISRTHGYDLYADRYDDQYIPFRDYIYNNVDWIYTISENGKNYLLEKYNGLLSGKISVSRLGVSNDYELDSLVIKQSTLTIVSCSYLVPVKRIHLIIDELSLINDTQVSWIHIGNGPLFEELFEYAKKKLSEKENIKFEFMGHFSNDKVYDFYATNHVDLLINLSESEGIPVSFMEAQSFSIPIIATNVGGVSELVNVRNGYLVDKNFNVGEVANIILGYSKLSQEEKNLKRRQSYEMWQDHYNADKNYRVFMQQIQNEF